MKRIVVYVKDKQNAIITSGELHGVIGCTEKDGTIGPWVVIFHRVPGLKAAEVFPMSEYTVEVR